MIRHTIISLLFLGLISFKPAKNLKTNDKPNIKTLKIVTYFPESEEKVVSRRKALSSKKYVIEDYNRDGHLIKRVYFDKNGKSTSSNNFAYNKQGDIIESKQFHTPKITKTKSGATIVSKPVDFHEKTEYTYNSDLQKKSVIKTDMNSGKIKQIYYKYSSKNLIEKTSELLNTKNKQTITYSYNLNNTIDSVKEYSNGILKKIIVNKYDNLGVKTEKRSTIYLKDNLTKATVYKYDKHGNNVEIIYESKDGSHTRIVSEYDTNGTELKTIWYNKKGEITTTYSYEYINDKYDNYITAKTYSNNKIYTISERKIKYYK